MKKYLSFLLFLFFSAQVYSTDLSVFWRFPEIAEKNSVFVDIGIPLYFADLQNTYFLPLNIRADFMLPFSLPVSAGFFLDTPYPNLKSFGIRVGYHIDIFDKFTDFYLIHSFNFGFLLEGVLAYYNDTTNPVRFFDYRIGLRRFFKSGFGVSIETGYHLESVFVSLSLKLN